MSDIGKGDWVECIKDRSARGCASSGDRPITGRIYLVRDVVRGEYRDGSAGVGLFLEGLTAKTADGMPGAYDVECFRPIYSPKAELIESLKTSAPKREPVAK